MNRSRVIILVLAGFAAIVAAFLVRGLLGGGTAPVKAAILPESTTMGVLVASTAIQPGTAITPDAVHWQNWPRASVDASFISQTGNPDVASIVKGTVARAPIVAGEPLTGTKIVHADAASFMSARLTPGMRAVSTPISTDTGAGGFILPNDRVDVLLTQQISDNPRRYASKVLLNNIRVLAMDQTFTQDKDQKTVLAKTATLELSPDQAEGLLRSAPSGTISLTLRPLGESSDAAVAARTHKTGDDDVTVIRYAVARNGLDSKGE